MTIDVGECAAIEKPDARLACLEAQIEAARQAPAAPAAPAPAARQAPVAPAPVAPAPVAPAPVVRAAPAAPAPAARPSPPAEPSSKAAVEAPPPARQRSDEKSARAERDSEQQAEIVAKVVELRETVPNAFLITLDNGQVWRQASPEPYPLRTGLEVRLRPGKWGTAYRLTAPELRGQIQVKRER